MIDNKLPSANSQDEFPVRWSREFRLHILRTPLLDKILHWVAFMSVVSNDTHTQIPKLPPLSEPGHMKEMSCYIHSLAKKFEFLINSIKLNLKFLKYASCPTQILKVSSTWKERWKERRQKARWTESAISVNLDIRFAFRCRYKVRHTIAVRVTQITLRISRTVHWTILWIIRCRRTASIVNWRFDWGQMLNWGLHCELMNWRLHSCRVHFLNCQCGFLLLLLF